MGQWVADRDGGDRRCKDKVNLTDGLLNRLPTGLRLQVNICLPSGTEMPSLYAILCDTKGMPSNPGQAEAFFFDPAKSPQALASSSGGRRWAGRANLGEAARPARACDGA